MPGDQAVPHLNQPDAGWESAQGRQAMLVLVRAHARMHAWSLVMCPYIYLSVTDLP